MVKQKARVLKRYGVADNIVVKGWEARLKVEAMAPIYTQ